MAVIIANGCFDVLHNGHKWFLDCAKALGAPLYRNPNGSLCLDASGAKHNRLIIAVNSDRSARELKAAKWGEKYPIQNQVERMAALAPYADEIVGFDSEAELRQLVEWLAPCVLCKGPDYAGKSVTGDDLAPVIILDTPEPEQVKQMKVRVYGQAAFCTPGKPSDR
jgi:D-beta-D-heptose 7-phosphate kinase / D-beta-D-heptose 1-phosphate adenosyltransferase